MKPLNYEFSFQKLKLTNLNTTKIYKVRPYIFLVKGFGKLNNMIMIIMPELIRT